MHSRCVVTRLTSTSPAACIRRWRLPEHRRWRRRPQAVQPVSSSLLVSPSLRPPPAPVPPCRSERCPRQSRPPLLRRRPPLLATWPPPHKILHKEPSHPQNPFRMSRAAQSLRLPQHDPRTFRPQKASPPKCYFKTKDQNLQCLDYAR